MAVAGRQFPSLQLGLRFVRFWSLWLAVVLVSEKMRDAVYNEGIGGGEERDGWHSCESAKSQWLDVRVAWVLRL